MMARYMLARQLSGRKVISNEGEDLGRVVDVAINEVSGAMEYIVLDPNHDSPTVSKLKKVNTKAYLPFETVMAVSDYVVVDKRHISE
jgi:sporulation protein YlmC with PRC-barrel domain